MVGGGLHFSAAVLVVGVQASGRVLAACLKNERTTRPLSWTICRRPANSKQFAVRQ